MAQTEEPQKPLSEWDEAAESFAAGILEELTSELNKARLLPLLDEHRTLVAKSLVICSRATMRWMGKLAKADVDIAPADDAPEMTDCCFGCQVKFNPGDAFHLWVIDSLQRALCAVCDAAKKADVLKNKRKKP